MYTKKIPYKNFNDEPRTKSVSFNLTIPETFKLLVEFKSIFAWREQLNDLDNIRELPTEEVIEFYSNLEKIILDAYGEPSEDGEHFRKSGRYDFEESAQFPAIMVSFLTDTQGALELIDGLMPKDLQEVVEKADASMAELAKDPANSPALQAQIAQLQAELAAAKNQPEAPTAP